MTDRRTVELYVGDAPARRGAGDEGFSTRDVNSNDGIPTMANHGSTRVTRIAAPIRNQVVDLLRQDIATVRFRPGQRLVEGELTERYGVSRGSVREAMRQLESDGLIEVVPHKGSVVAVITAEQAMHIYQTRAVLEGLAGRLFAINASAGELEELAGTVDRIATATSAGDIEGILEGKVAFYDVLLRGAGNDVITGVLRSLHARAHQLRYLSLSGEGRPDASLAELRAIVEVARARDADKTERACIGHVENAATTALREFAAEKAG